MKTSAHPAAPHPNQRTAGQRPGQRAAGYGPGWPLTMTALLRELVDLHGTVARVETGRAPLLVVDGWLMTSPTYTEPVDVFAFNVLAVETRATVGGERIFVVDGHRFRVTHPDRVLIEARWLRD